VVRQARDVVPGAIMPCPLTPLDSCWHSEVFPDVEKEIRVAI
jgi:hypothetical protein